MTDIPSSIKEPFNACTYCREGKGITRKSGNCWEASLVLSPKRKRRNMNSI
jgi:hypothetical protein